MLFEGLERRDAAGYVEAFPVILDIEYAGWTSAKRLFRLDMLGVYKADDGRLESIAQLFHNTVNQFYI